MKTKLKCKWCHKEIKNKRHLALCSMRPAARDSVASPDELALVKQVIVANKEAKENTVILSPRNPEDSPLKKFRCLRTCFVWNRYFEKDAIYDIPCELDIESKNFVPYEEGG